MSQLVSIILPTYNGAQLISRAIESVRSQTYQEWELLVISDGSTDDTTVIVEAFSRNDPRIVFIKNEHNLGIQKTLNKGIVLARGKYIARIDDDDAWIDPLKLEAQVSFLEQHPDYVLVGTDARVIDEKGNTLTLNIMPRTDYSIRSKILSKNCFLHSTVLFRKITGEGYSEKKETLHAEDYELWLRIGKEGKMANLEIVSTALTAHGNSLTSKNRVAQAKNMLRSVIAYKSAYPHFIFGYTAALARLVFFFLLDIVPIPRSLFYGIQRIYRSV